MGEHAAAVVGDEGAGDLYGVYGVGYGAGSEVGGGEGGGGDGCADAAWGE